MNQVKILEFVVPLPKMDQLNQIIKIIQTLDGVVNITQSEGTNREKLNITITETSDEKGLSSFISNILNGL